jgi:hypothetical protein
MTNTSYPRSESSSEPTLHSALSTILLDDSPKKARLQPWNHLCIDEYTPKMRVRDEALLKEKPEPRNISLDEASPCPTLPTATPSSHVGTAAQHPAGLPPKPSTTRSAVSSPDHLIQFTPTQAASHNETLLAVVGVLDTLKNETNAASWIKSGGLFTLANLSSNGLLEQRSGDAHAAEPHAAVEEKQDGESRDQSTDPKVARATRRKEKKEAKRAKKAEKYAESRAPPDAFYPSIVIVV